MIPPVKNRFMTSYGGIIRIRYKGYQPNYELPLVITLLLYRYFRKKSTYLY